MDSTFTSQLATALVIAMVPVIIGGLGYLARSVIAFVKAKTSAEQYGMLEKLAAQAVLAAEQTMKNSAGAKKLEAAKLAAKTTEAEQQKSKPNNARP